jgi:hypothetical protein
LFNLLLSRTLLHLLFDLLERRRVGRAGVFKHDDVVAEVGLDRGLGVFVLLELGQCLAKRLDVGIRGAPAEFAAFVLGAWILGNLGQLGELFALVELGDDALASSSSATRIWRALYSVVPRLVLITSYSALSWASLIGWP